MDNHELSVVGLLGPLQRYARSLTRSDKDAEDLVHDTLVRALERRDSFKEGSPLRSWLFSILHNLFVDGRRSAKAEQRRRGEALELADGWEGPGQESRVRLRQVAAMFERLPLDYRSALHLVVVEDMSYADAAATLGISVNTLTSRLGRARAALREMEADETGGSTRPRLRVVGGSDV
jgi:RNA polymerase sigma factor (sigma-70 family)